MVDELGYPQPQRDRLGGGVGAISEVLPDRGGESSWQLSLQGQASRPSVEQFW